MSKIKAITQGVKGASSKEIELGYINIQVDNNPFDKIVIDAFCGSGHTYKRRDYSIIEMYDSNQLVFRGTFEQLIYRLKKYSK
jgi:hypothetical protein